MLKQGRTAEYIRLIRVRHYVKNLLVFTALAFSGQLLVLNKLLHALIGFAVFCAASSVVYIINDVRDIERDRRHPTKCLRPLASGSISVKNAWVLAALLAAVACVGNLAVYHPTSTLVLAAYVGMNWAYSAGLKNVPLIDVTILVVGFLLRIVYGAVITDIVLSDWLYLTVIALAYYFALGKRRNELSQLHPKKNTRKVLQHYNRDFLDKNMHMCLAISLVFYALWSMDAGTASRYGGIQPILTVPIVLLIMMKYSMDVEGDSDGDPVEVLSHDRLLVALCLIYFIVMFSSLYV